MGGENNITKVYFSSMPKQLVSEDLKHEIALFVVSVIIVVAPFGIVSNIINSVVFFKLGLTTTSNKSFFWLAVSDLYCLIWILLLALGFIMPLYHLPMIIDLRAVVEVVSTLFFSCSAFGSWVTTIISLERSCCIVFPMKVKLIFTSRILTLMMSVMIVYQIATSIPYYFTVVVVPRVNPVTNWTYILLLPLKRKELATMSHAISYSVPTSICFIVVVIATIFLIISFKRSRKLREAMTTGKAGDSTKIKDARLVNSVIIVCVIYICGYSLSVALFMTTLAGINLTAWDPYYGNLSTLLYLSSFLLQALGCSVNIFVYYRMNSSYRTTLKSLFCIQGNAKT